ncbi:putative FmdB family regulatory protein [Halanaerobium saccharolyticum]|uniref:Putative FmdB family regulatory protein n=1 Tax=Halanaerobium saccharolyticum TaxID=43595 RepID=A0A4R6LH98_9FIRM|nr:FmdB family zinc ribbon protein [Halanaerobium saccharolyticum]TDO83319.1 putative FmdB family regulatory protein [Halanaerobium saccharolyticum]
MPTYLYECEKCGRFEEFQNISEDALEECPECSGEVKRIIGSPGIIFKGSNFYVNQDKKSSTNNSTKSSTKSNEKKSEKVS